MTKSMNPPGSFEHDGKTYQLDMGVNTICKIENKFDLPMPKVAEKMESDPRVSFVRTVFHQALLENHPDLHERDAGLIMTGLGIQRVGDLLSEISAGSPLAD